MNDSVTICKNTGMPITGKVNIPTLVSLLVVIANDTVSLYTFGSACRNTDVLCTKTKLYP